MSVGGAPITFGANTRYGAIAAAQGGMALVDPGYDLVRGREVSGLSASPDLGLAVTPTGVLLSGVGERVANGALRVSAPSGQMSVPAVPLNYLVVVDSQGAYALVGIVSATPEVVTFAYKLQTAGQGYVLTPPTPSQIGHPPAFRGDGVPIYSVIAPLRAGTSELRSVYGYALGQHRIAAVAGMAEDRDPQLSPTGAMLATSEGSDLVLTAAGGTTRTLATNLDVLGAVPPAVSWSPDGSYLAYRGMVEANGEVYGGGLWVVQPATGRSRLVVDPASTGLAVKDVHWLPKDRLIFSTGKAFYTVSADWTAESRLPIVAGAMGDDGRFDVSWNGRLITWVALGAHDRYQVVVAPLAGGPTLETTDRWNNASPAFSPDGAWVMAVAERGPAPGGTLWLLALSGGRAGDLAAPGKGPAVVDHVSRLLEWYPGAVLPPWLAG
jgi:Tol biopolymer transport system component/uncharacterized protein (DUF433 family)